MLLGEDNIADAPTGLVHEGDGPTLRVENLDGGPGIGVVSNKAPALQGFSPSGGLLGSTVTFSVTQLSDGVGVQGTGGRFGVAGTIVPDGVAITETLVAGVWGTSTLGTTTTLTGTYGLAGTAYGGDQIGVVAHNPSGVALSVMGGIKLSCGGRGTIEARRREVEILDASIAPGSVVLVSLSDDPGNSGVAVQYVRTEAGRAVVGLTAPVTRETGFTYLCFGLDSA
jgi:hypothetical protein